MTDDLEGLLRETIELERVTFDAYGKRWLPHPKLFEEGSIPVSWSPPYGWLIGEELRVAVNNFDTIVRRWGNVLSSPLLPSIEGVPDLLMLSANVRSHGNASRRRLELLELNDLVFALGHFLDECGPDISRLIVVIEAAIKSPAAGEEWVGPLTTKEWARLFKVTERTLLNWVKGGLLLKGEHSTQGRVYFSKNSGGMSAEVFDRATNLSRNRKPAGSASEAHRKPSED